MTHSLLIVDDEDSVVLSLSMAFESAGWEIGTAGSAEEALRSMSERTYDALLIDKNLPGLTGVDLIRELRKVGANPVMLIITAFASRDSALQALHLGVDGYIEKPFDDIFSLVERVNRLVNLKKRKSQTLTAATAHFQKATAQLQAVAQPSKQTTCLVVAAQRDDALELGGLAAQVSDTVHRAVSIQEGLDLMAAHTCHLVVIDARLGWENLEELVRTIKKPGSGPGIVVVGDSDPPLRVITRLIEHGVHSVLKRPLDREEILGRLLAERKLSGDPPPRESDQPEPNP